MHIQRYWIRFYSVGHFLEALGWGLYYAISRIYIKEFLGGTYTDVLLLSAAEYAPVLSSAFWGMLADRFGRKKFILLGLFSAPSLALVGYFGIPYVQFFVFIASLAWAASWPSIIAPIVSEKTESGFRYGVVTLGGSLGWGLGCSLMGFIYGFGNVSLVTLTAGLFLALSYIVFYLAFPRKYDVAHGEGVSDFKGIRNLPRTMLLFLLAAGVSYFGISWAFNVLSIKLYVELGRNEVLYGIFYGGLTSLIAAIVRPYVGKLSDQIGSLKLYRIALISYSILVTALALSRGFITAILWLIPVYPFYDISLVSTVSRLAPNHLKASALGSMYTVISLSGTLVFIAGPLTDILGSQNSVICASLLQFIALIMLFSKILKA